MDANTMLLLGMIKLKNPKTGEEQLIEIRGFDVLGFFVPILRYLFAGMLKEALLAFFASCTIIGIPIVAWYTAFNFRKMRFENMIREGWQMVEEKKTAPMESLSTQKMAA